MSIGGDKTPEGAGTSSIAHSAALRLMARLRAARVSWAQPRLSAWG